MKKHVLIYIFLPKFDIEKRQRFSYVRYADDFVIGISGTQKRAEVIKELVRKHLLENLQLELNEDKTKITSRNDGFVFLGFLIYTDQRVPRLKMAHNGQPFKFDPKVVVKVATKNLINKLEAEGLVKKNRLNHLSVVPKR